MKWSELFNFHDEMAKGRSCMLISAPLNRIILNLSQAALYTAFLTANGFSIIEVGTLSYLSFLASCFSFVAPGFLEKIRKRKWVLAGILFSYYLVFLAGLSTAALTVTDHQTKFLLFAVLVFIGAFLDKLSTSGYTAWHLRFIPDRVRAGYFLYQNRIQIFVSALSLIFLGSLVDFVHSLPNELFILSMLRYGGFLLGLLNIAVLLLPVEYPYPRKEEKTSLKKVFTLPLQNSRFIKCVAAVAMWSIATGLTESAWVYYLLNTVGTGAGFQNIYAIVYAVGLFALGGLFQRIHRKYRWIRTFCLSAFIHVPTFFLCAFVNSSNYIWLYGLIQVIRGIEGVGLNLTYENLTYINLPETDTTYYLSFSFMVTNIASFLGQFLGTVLLGLLGDTVLSIGAFSFDSVQILVLIQTGLALICPVFLMVNRNELEPLKNTL